MRASSTRKKILVVFSEIEAVVYYQANTEKRHDLCGTLPSSLHKLFMSFRDVQMPHKIDK